MRYFIVASAILGIMSCRSSPERESNILSSERLPVKVKDLNNKEIPEGLLVLSEREYAETTPLSKEMYGNLFGRFFDDRAEFFIIENPANKIYSSKIRSVTMYYLEGQLCKTKYLVENDIVDKLIERYGPFKFKSYDYRNNEILKVEEILTRSGEGYKINDRLNNYQLKWTFNNKEIKYKVSRKQNEQYVYVESLKDFAKDFRQIERSY